MKKKGSTLITVVIMSALLFTVGGAMITMITSDYKLRITESKRLQNLYGAESGIDIAYNIIIKTFNVAVKEGNKVVEDKYNEIQNNSELSSNSEYIINTLNKEFEDKFKDIISKELKVSIEEGKYVTNTSIPADSLSEGRYTKVDFNLPDGKKPNLLARIDFSEEEDRFNIEVISDIISQENDKTLRTVSAKYKLLIPEYSGFYEENKQIAKYPIWTNKVINIDGDMKVWGNVEVNGDVSVYGKESDIEKNSVVYDKYKGGISLENNEKINDSTNIDFNGNIITSKSLSIRDGAKAVVNGNVYSSNVYIGEEKFGGNQGLNRELIINGDVIVNNDLALNAKRSTVSIRDFYGINDITTDTVLDKKARKSSSILVNENEDSQLKIKNSAYIMGVGYIDTKGENGSYGTGESIAVKGNYIAYSNLIENNDKYNKENVKFEYYQPLQLVEGFVDGVNDEFSKSEYFKAYSETNIDKLKNGGIILPKITYAAGAIVGKDNQTNQEVLVKINPVTPDAYNEILNKRASYANEVYKMGSLSKSNENDISNLVEIYNNPIDIMTIASEVDFNKMNNYVSPNNEKEKLILNNNPNKTIVIVGQDGNDSEYMDKDKYIILNAKVNKDINALIITAGDVIITGEVELRGNIIAKNDLFVEGINKSGRKVKLSYDERITTGITSRHYEKLKDVIKVSESNGEINQETIKIDESLAIEQDINNYLETGIWKIVK
ncbi:hypothetical protein [Clostridium sp.]|uniref:hypothetical protein n=1 Tax=Clostridium sp. TaxID=1506 RepID=UPI003F3CF168